MTKGWGYRFKFNSHSYVRNLITLNSFVSIEDFSFKNWIFLSDAVKFFPLFDTAEFNNRYFYNSEDEEEISFEKVQVKHIIFSKWNFYSNKLIKEVFVNSGFAKSLNKITFSNMWDQAKMILKF